MELSTVSEIKEALIQTSQSSNAMMSNAIKAQLQVLEFIQHPDLYESSFDLLIENIDFALNLADNQIIRHELQRRVSIMINSLFFFMEAKFLYSKSENRKQGLALAEKSCEMLAESTACFLKNGCNQTAAIISASKLFENAFLSEDGEGVSFFRKVVKWYNEDIENERKENEFYCLLTSMIEKVKRNQEVFGKSRIISELILRYKDRLVIYNTPIPITKKKALSLFFHTIWLGLMVVFCMFSVWIISLFVKTGDKLMDKISIGIVNTDPWYNHSFDWFLTSLYGSAVVIFSMLLIGYVRLYLSNYKYRKNINLLDDYYLFVSNLFR